MRDLVDSLRQTVRTLRATKADWALVGGMALSVYGRIRTTRDLDFAVAVDSDAAAERVVSHLLSSGFTHEEVFEHRPTRRLSTMRLREPGHGGLPIDLLFVSSGIEDLVVSGARLSEMVPGLSVPVARLGHLIALKVLADRPIDVEDAVELSRDALRQDLFEARDALERILRRGFDRDRGEGLLTDFSTILSRAGRIL